MPNTRASARKTVSRRGLRRREHTATSEDELNSSVRHTREDTEIETGMQSIMEHLQEAKSGVEQLNTRIRFLERENENLESELQQAQQSALRGRGVISGSGAKAFQRRIQLLERKIADLDAAREKDRRTIEKLRETEVRREAKELANDHEAVSTQQMEDEDLGESAKKLLRRVCDTIDMNTLAEGEECAICIEQMEVEKCYSLPCRHPVCATCFGRLGDGSSAVSNDRKESVQCPHCREVWPREECEIITHSAVRQWDLLLDISRQWAAIDVAEMDIGGSDDGDSFIDDSPALARESSHPSEPSEEVADPNAEISIGLACDTGGAYKGLSSPLKRKRLTELAARRATKQRV